MQKNTKLFMGFLVILLFIIGITFWLLSSSSQSTLPTPIKIGVLAPLSGQLAIIGQYMQEGLSLAQETINDQGGIHGKLIELVYEDTLVDPKLSVNAFQKFMTVDKIKVVIGDYRSPNTLAVAPLAEANKVILISPGSQADSISFAGEYIFRTQVTAELEAKKLAEFLCSSLEEKEISTLVTNQDYGVSFEEKFTRYFKDCDGKVKSNHRAETQENDYRTILLKIQQSNTHDVVLAIGGSAAALVAKQTKELGIPLRFYASSIVQTDDLLKFGNTIVEGLIYVYPYDIETRDKIQQQFTQKYIERFGRENDAVAANSYDALMIVASAMKACEENTSCLKDELYKVRDYLGASGTLSFDKHGDVIKLITIKTVKSGKFVNYAS